MRRRIFRFVVPALLIALGASQVASGAWIHAKALLAQALLEYAWQCTLNGEERARPWPWADTWPVARLSIPRLDASMIVLAGDTGRTLAFGPGHTHGSALPGTRGTAIVNGHRDTHFAVLRDVVEGDEVFVEARDGRVLRYVVDELAVADSRSTRVGAADDAAALVLITCWPFDALRPGGPMRYVVTARPDVLPHEATAHLSGRVVSEARHTASTQLACLHSSQQTDSAVLQSPWRRWHHRGEPGGLD